jgi:hypothetical protein
MELDGPYDSISKLPQELFFKTGGEVAMAKLMKERDTQKWLVADTEVSAVDRVMDKFTDMNTVSTVWFFQIIHFIYYRLHLYDNIRQHI